MRFLCLNRAKEAVPTINRYFDDIRIPANSPLAEHLNIKPGNYSGKFDATQGKLLLKQKGSDQILSLSVTLDELVAILMMVKRDKFTSEELEIIQKIRHSSSFSGSRISSAHAENFLEERWHDLVEAEQEDWGAVQEVLMEIIDFLNDTINKMLPSGICTIDDV